MAWFVRFVTENMVHIEPVKDEEKHSVDLAGSWPENYTAPAALYVTCSTCVFYRIERRKLWSKIRHNLCAVNSPYWPDASACNVYMEKP